MPAFNSAPPTSLGGGGGGDLFNLTFDSPKKAGFYTAPKVVSITAVMVSVSSFYSA